MAPLVVVAVFAFNDSLFPSLPWQGFTWGWFFSDAEPKLGLFHDQQLYKSIGTSFLVASFTTILAVSLAVNNAFLFERKTFPGKNILYMLMLLPLVIPGVILGVSILIMSSTIANYFDEVWAIDIEILRPGLALVVVGQFAFITTICTLIVAARLRNFDLSLEEAALNLGATKLQAIRTITIPYLLPAIVGAAVISFFMSFENFNTTLMLVGSDSPLTITLYDRLREGATPVINAVSLLLMLASILLAFANYFLKGKNSSIK
ncbi:putrescine ABC transporter permease PotI [Psychromonas marina]|uniref:Putrescine ABC transporter permease PotI n=2 Tax=Psychromonas marina TaxID=88364 RepID=A0ABQ6DW34_9GAMM|nr:putrescine ABC transporter permease PotI [Psychromonas marina]